MSRPDWARGRGRCQTKNELQIDVEAEASEIIEEYDLSFSMDDIQIEISGRMTRALGVFSTDGTKPHTVKISWPGYENHGWEELKVTLRHELAHADQYERRGHTKHDKEFHQMSEEMDFEVSADEPADGANYVIECQGCGDTWYRVNKSKVIKKPEKYRCKECGSNIKTYEYDD